MRPFRFSLLISLLALSLGAFTFSQQKAEEKGPRITFSKLEHDFGEVAQEKTYDYVFEFTNTGNETLVIERVQPSCGCTAALVDSSQIPPGGKGRIKVSFDSQQFSGHVMKTVWVYSNDPTKRAVELKFKAFVRQEVMVSMQALFIGHNSRTDPLTRTIEITSSMDKPLQISDLKTDVPYITAQIKQQDQRRALLEVTFDPRKLAGPETRPSGRVEFKTNSQKFPQFTIPVYVFLPEELSFQPDRLIFSAKRGEEKEFEIRLRNGSGKKFKVTKVESVATGDLTGQDVDISYRVIDAANQGEDTKVVVKFPGNMTPGSKAGEIRIHTDVAAQPLVKVPFFIYIY